jgi:hypothetical protein
VKVPKEARSGAGVNIRFSTTGVNEKGDSKHSTVCALMNSLIAGLRRDRSAT